MDYQPAVCGFFLTLIALTCALCPKPDLPASSQVIKSPTRLFGYYKVYDEFKVTMMCDGDSIIIAISCQADSTWSNTVSCPVTDRRHVPNNIMYGRDTEPTSTIAASTGDGNDGNDEGGLSANSVIVVVAGVILLGALFVTAVLCRVMHMKNGDASGADAVDAANNLASSFCQICKMFDLCGDDE